MQNFNYHSHTYRCGHADLDMTDEEYVNEYIKLGLKKVAFTDHAPEKNEIDIRKNMRMEYKQKDEYLSSIKYLKEKYKDKIEIKTGYEAEYLPGEENNLKELKKETDKLILGQHFIYDDDNRLKIFGSKTNFTDKELIRYAKYIERAMEEGIPDIIAHPDIYMINRKEFGKTEEEVAKIISSAAEKYKVPLEINLNKIFQATYYENRILNNDNIDLQRKKLKTNIAYPCKEFWNIVCNYKIKVLYGIDVHHRGQILLFNELIELAKEVLGEEIISKLDFIKDGDNL